MVQQDAYIQTSVLKLRDSFNAEQSMVYIGEVNYSDDLLPIGGYSFESLLFKRRSFAWEKEIRALTLANDVGSRNRQFSVPAGRFVRVDLKQLIETIYISPFAKKWFFDLVCATVEKYSFRFQCLKSNLLDSPSI